MTKEQYQAAAEGQNSVACVGLYTLSNHKVLIVLENKPKQIPGLTGISRMVKTQEVLNMSPRQGGLIMQGIALFLIVIVVSRGWRCLAKTIRRMERIRVLALCHIAAW